MEQQNLITPEASTKLENLSQPELVNHIHLLESELSRAVKEVYRLKYKDLTEEQLDIVLKEHLGELQHELYGASSERYKKPKEKKKKKKDPVPRKKKPSERYPNVTIREIPIQMEAPDCEACGKEMSDSGMTENSEQLTVTPKKYEILKYKRSIYRCSCQSCMKTAPLPPRIVPGSTYSDEMILDVALSKYCDLIPIERYVQMASRSGLMGLPPNTLYDLTHQLAFFVKQVYQRIGEEVFSSRVVRADETPHKMLEGSDKKSWYLWGFSTEKLVYFDYRDTRSGDVALEALVNSKCEVLLTDVYAGYGRAVRLVNEQRQKVNLPLVQSAYCNSHARRPFYKVRHKFKESHFYLDQYHEIYQLEPDKDENPSLEEIQRARSKIVPLFEAMKQRAKEELPRYFKGGKYQAALNYFLENYEGLTLCLKDPEVPLDNNAQERHLRSHVVGRKTWYGTHSEQGAETAAILFTLVESCKLNKVNPREYFEDLVEAILNRHPVLTPPEWKKQNH